MLGNFFLKMLMSVINLIDLHNKSKIIKFFKDAFNNKVLNILDIGAHKGETIDLFYKNFNVSKIYSFEPNINLFKILKANQKYNNDKIEIFNLGFGERTEVKELNIFKDTSSSTINYINEDTMYFKRKQKFMSFFFNNKNFLVEKQKVQIQNLSEFISEQSIDKIHILKIDTEGYEYKILKGLKNDDFKKIRFIYFEHHYDLMINKGYKFSDVDKFLTKNKFYKKYKLRMKFRKSFEYIYENSK
jgi:FkbM family methyltransferase